MQNWNNLAFADTYYSHSTQDSSTTNKLALAINVVSNFGDTLADPRKALEDAAAFLKTLRELLEAPATLLG